MDPTKPRSQPFSAVGRGFLTLSSDAGPMQFGRGATVAAAAVVPSQLPVPAPLLGFARGLPGTQDRLGLGRSARGMLLSPLASEPKAGTAAGAAPSPPGLDPLLPPPTPGQGPPPEEEKMKKPEEGGTAKMVGTNA